MVDCPFCKSGKVYFENDVHKSQYTKDEHKLYSCNSCMLHFWHPRKVYPEIYENEYFAPYAHFHSGTRSLPPWCKPFFRHFIQNIRPGMNLLDVGCAEGIFLSKARRYGLDVYGIDIDKKSTSVAQSNYSLNNIFPLSLKDFSEYAKKRNLKFDIITFFEVLEHQESPNDFMNTIKSLLKKGGRVIGSVPNRERLFVSLEHKLNKSDYPPHHFLRFNKKSLRINFETHGFAAIQLFATESSIHELSARFAQILISDASRLIRIKLKKNLEEEPKGSGSSKQKLNNRKLWKIIYVLLRGSRNICFTPVALLILPLIKLRGGTGIYFQMTKK